MRPVPFPSHCTASVCYSIFTPTSPLNPQIPMQPWLQWVALFFCCLPSRIRELRPWSGYRSDAKSCPTLCNPHGPQQARLPSPSVSPGVCSDSCPLDPWCHPGSGNAHEVWMQPDLLWGFPGGSAVKSPPCQGRRYSSVPGSGRSPGGGHGNPLQWPCLGNLMDRGAWQRTVQGVRKSWTLLNNNNRPAFNSHFLWTLIFVSRGRKIKILF